MERQQFKKFCEKEFELQGFKKKKNMFYLKGVDLLCRINLQKLHIPQELRIRSRGTERHSASN